MLLTILYILFFLSCLVLVLAVLLQPGKTDAGALFTSSVSSTAFGARGTQTILSKITIGAASMFMLTALLIAMPALQGNVSVLQTSETPAESAAPAANANTAANADANAPAANTNAANTNSAPAANADANAGPAANAAAPANAAANEAPAEKKEEPKKEESKSEEKKP